MTPTAAPGDPRLQTCPACNARPGEPCNAPTDSGRRNVTWHHLAREDAALKAATASAHPG